MHRIPTSASKKWLSDAAYELEEFIAIRVGEFTAQDVREFAYARGLDHPASERAWGAVVNAAAKRGSIKRVGFVRCEYLYADRSSSAPQTLWVPA